MTTEEMKKLAATSDWYVFTGEALYDLKEMKAYLPNGRELSLESREGWTEEELVRWWTWVEKDETGVYPIVLRHEPNITDEDIIGSPEVVERAGQQMAEDARNQEAFYKEWDRLKAQGMENDAAAHRALWNVLGPEKSRYVLPKDVWRKFVWSEAVRRAAEKRKRGQADGSGG